MRDLARWGRIAATTGLAVALIVGAGPGHEAAHGPGPDAVQADAPDDAARRRCEAQCLLHSMYWCSDTYGALCWSTLEDACAITPRELFINAAINFVTGSGALSLIDPGALMDLAQCMAALRGCFADIHGGCSAECASNPLAYAPNPSVAWNPGGNRADGVTYDEAAKVLRVRIRNTGYAPCGPVGYSVSIGSTTNQDRRVTGTVVESGSVPGLAPACTQRIGPDIPPKEHAFTIPFEAVAGRYYEILLAVDGSQLIEETNELDNLCRLRIDRLPSPCQVEIEGVRVERPAGTLGRANLHPTLHARGEEACETTWQLLAGAPPADGAPLAQGTTYLRHDVRHELTIPVALDLGQGSPSGARHARFTLRVTDATGRIHDERAIDVPLLAGSISGRVTGALDKPVAGATVTASAGGQTLASTQTGSGGFYHLEGLATLGDVTVTASHPSYSASASRTVTLAYEPGAADPEAGLAHQGIDLVLTNTPGVLVIVVMDAWTHQPLGGASWAAVSPPHRHAGVMEADVATVTLEGCAPGEWLVTASKAGYETATERTILTTGQASTVTLWLERFRPREDDQGLRLHPPESLWKRTLDGWVYAHASSKDGSLLVLYTADPAVPGSGRLLFLDALRGTLRASVPCASPKGQQQASLDVAWRGDPVAFALNEGPFGRPGPVRLALFGPRGQPRAQLTAPPRQAPYVEVAPDGAWVYAWGLFDGALREVPDHRPLDPRGYPQGWPQETYVTGETIHFTRDGRFIGLCPKGAGAKVCRLTLAEEVVEEFPGVEPALRILDGGGPSGVLGAGGNEVLLICTDKALYRVEGTSATWSITPPQLGLPPGHSFQVPSASLSPGGEVLMFVEGGRHGRLRVYSWGPRPADLPFAGEADREVTPAGLPPWVQHVSANEQGLFFLMVKGHEAEYLRMGSYGDPPRPPPPLPPPPPPRPPHPEHPPAMGG